MTKGFKSLIVLMGLPSSGKSTIAKLLAKDLEKKLGSSTILIGTDDIRAMDSNQRGVFDPSKEPEIKHTTLNKIQSHLTNNNIVINDDMNYYKSMRHELKQIAFEHQAHFVIIHIQIPLGIALDWNEKRGLPIPQEVIKRVQERFDPPGDYKWDNPLLTIHSHEVEPESAVQMILSELIPLITVPYEPESPPEPTKPGIKEQIDKMTREIVSYFAKGIKDPTVQKKISVFRISYLRNLTDKEIPLDSLKNDFSQKLKELISALTQAK